MNLNLLQTQVINKCGTKARDAVENNKVLQGGDRRLISKEIIDHTLEYLAGLFGSESPSKFCFYFYKNNVCFINDSY